ncbi:hypothetical protein IFR04_007362 [Cadophora malorum]|uniref:Zn(2)-C6 fungal-type domain-containing protein n=1 Tax=Cadophora malorum TaxID=108018 RepID=A0A8H7WAG0_9HELO|nr:hypothetical protein IFR04_007362 [Cadophora malorum]
MKSFSGCWTCRLRRKKCDEKQPVCGVCSSLLIGHACYYEKEKPEWMDGGSKQEEMSRVLKFEIKENAQRRRWASISEYQNNDSEMVLDEWAQAMPTRQVLTPPLDVTRCNVPRVIQQPSNQGSFQPHLESSATPLPQQRGPSCDLTRKDSPKNTSIPFSRTDTILFTFYLEQVHPFLFPFYNPSPLSGGRSWILEMMLSSPVHQAAYLSQSSYLFSLAQDSQGGSLYSNPTSHPHPHSHNNLYPDTPLTQTIDAFGVLREALQVIDGPQAACTEHIHGSVRVLGSILQVQHFEITFSGFDNWQAHLSGAIALFKHLLDSQIPSAVNPKSASLKFSAVMRHLGSSTGFKASMGAGGVQSAEQAALSFAASVLIVDDVIASTALQEEPRLYAYHQGLLTKVGDQEPLVNLEAVVGCQNWVVLQIGEIAVLDAWKQRCNRLASLDMIELVRRGTVIKDALEGQLTLLEKTPATQKRQQVGLLNVFTEGYDNLSTASTSQSVIATQIWAHAAFIYLSIVVSGWQPKDIELCYHVRRIIDLLSYLSPPALVRSMIWPFCVAGCLADQSQERHFRDFIEGLHPPALFSSNRYALRIMEEVWRSRTEDTDADDSSSRDRDLATCFRGLGELILLV